MKAQLCRSDENNIEKPPFLDEFVTEAAWYDEHPESSGIEIACTFKPFAEQRLGVKNNVEMVVFEDLINEAIERGHELDKYLKCLEKITEKVRSAIKDKEVDSCPE